MSGQDSGREEPAGPEQPSDGSREPWPGRGQDGSGGYQRDRDDDGWADPNRGTAGGGSGTWGGTPSWGPSGPWDQQPRASQDQPGPHGQAQPGPGQTPPGQQAPWNGTPPVYPGAAYPHQPYGTPYGPASGIQYGHQYGSPYGQPRYVAPPKPGIVPLRPLMFGEILDGSFQAIRRNPKAMLGAALLAQSLSAILAAVVTAVSATSAGSIEAWVEGASPADLAGMGFGFAGAILVVSILTLVISAVLQGAMVVPVARSILNRPTGFRQMWALAKSRAGALIGLAALLVAAVLLAFLIFGGAAFALIAGTDRAAGALFLIPLVPAFIAVFAWIAIKVMVAPAAVVIEEVGPLAALRRSWQLTRANWWRIFGMTLVVSLLVGVISQVVMIPVSLLTSFLGTVVSPHGGSGQDAGMAVALGIATAVLGALVGALGYAFQTSVMALLYMDLRMRKDGLDITLLRLLETGADPDGVPGRGAAFTAPGRGSQGPSGSAWPDVR